ncbi:hypothetical protein V9T40_013133 [Parthenolecanium corni]|uniref:Uncharacterized protein n=1 Tax=Parthenolecanium corni TaxID=536013 RepID=A0AAN9TYL2_9HEMI
MPDNKMRHLIVTNVTATSPTSPTSSTFSHLGVGHSGRPATQLDGPGPEGQPELAKRIWPFAAECGCDCRVTAVNAAPISGNVLSARRHVTAANAAAAVVVALMNAIHPTPTPRLAGYSCKCGAICRHCYRANDANDANDANGNGKSGEKISLVGRRTSNTKPKLINILMPSKLNRAQL